MHSRHGSRGLGSARSGTGLLVAGIMFAGCSVSADPSSTALVVSSPSDSPAANVAGPAAIDYAHGRTDVILRFDRLPDYAIEGELGSAIFRPGPEFTLYGDGTVIFLSDRTSTPAFDPPVERAAPFVTAQLTEAQVQALLRVAVDVGGLESARSTYPSLDTDCFSWSRFMLRTLRISADVEYACGPYEPVEDSLLATDDERLRNGLARLAQYLSRFDVETGLETTVWEPDRYTATLADLPNAPIGEVIAWPWPDLDLSDFSTPAPEYPWDLSARRRVISAVEAGMLRVAAIRGGIQGIELGSPYRGEATWKLALWPLFPDDDGRSSGDATPAPGASETPTPSPTPSPSANPTPTPSPLPTPTPTPIPTPWPMAVMSGSGLSKGLPFTFLVWIDHEDVPYGSFSGSVPNPSGAALVIEGPVTCASIDGNIGVFGGRSDATSTDFTVMVSDRPDGMIIGTGRFACDTTGFGDPASLPITDGDILVMPEP